MGRSNWPTTSRHKRGYGTAWVKTRERILARDRGICQPCLKQRRIHAGNEVDHVISKAKAERMGWTQQQIEADSNLQAINVDCHKVKTTLEKGHKVRPTIGIDGYPITP